MYVVIAIDAAGNRHPHGPVSVLADDGDLFAAITIGRDQLAKPEEFEMEGFLVIHRASGEVRHEEWR